ncbi:uncharacterized protein LOC109246675 [Panthera pardus]|uniref:Uncharacterized protein LOC109246675 n=1 Tax=Panthera pardus TaxID=9691 RepID=A0A9W2VDI0_PANPR|nr:uncharacterized protein LOC109246675 [Panthera pardus]
MQDWGVNDPLCLRPTSGSLSNSLLGTAHGGASSRGVPPGSSPPLRAGALSGREPGRGGAAGRFPGRGARRGERASPWRTLQARLAAASFPAPPAPGTSPSHPPRRAPATASPPDAARTAGPPREGGSRGRLQPEIMALLTGVK